METVLQELIKEFGTYDNVEMKCITIQNLLRNKLHKEKQQIIDAYKEGLNSDCLQEQNEDFFAEKYFKQTFNS